MYGTNRRRLGGEEELTITSTNLNGLTEYRAEEIKTLADDGIDVIMFQETWRRGDGLGEKPRLSGYKSYTNERMGEDKKGGGLAVLVKDDLMSNDWLGEPETEEEVSVGRPSVALIVSSDFINVFFIAP